MKKFFVIVSLLFFFVTIGVGWVAYDNILSPVDDNDTAEVIFDVPPKTSMHKLIDNLYEHQFIKDPTIFYYFIRIIHAGDKVKAGEYKISRSMTPESIWRVISSGKSVERLFTVKEGLNIYEISQLFQDQGYGKSEDFLTLCSDKALAHELTNLELNSLEGFLFPDTYKINKYVGAKELIKTMVKKSLTVIGDIRKVSSTKESILRHVTMASIVEKETGAPDERQLISSVLHNRLKIGMRLQMDPTVIYGIWKRTGKYKDNITRTDLTTPTDYNTYTINGLPPGPISNPGRDSLYAALHPALSNYLYFVSRNDGTHTFTANLKDHNKAVGKFQLDQKARKGKSWRNLKKTSTAKKTLNK